MARGKDVTRSIMLRVGIVRIPEKKSNKTKIREKAGERDRERRSERDNYDDGSRARCNYSEASETMIVLGYTHVVGIVGF